METPFKDLVLDYLFYAQIDRECNFFSPYPYWVTFLLFIIVVVFGYIRRDKLHLLLKNWLSSRPQIKKWISTLLIEEDKAPVEELVPSSLLIASPEKEESKEEDCYKKEIAIEGGKEFGEWIDFLKSIGNSKLDPKIEQFILDRHKRLMSIWTSAGVSNKEKWAIEVVDFIDELCLLETGLSFKDRIQLQQAIICLMHILGAMSIEVLRLNKWDPECQRAIAVERVLPEGADPCITEYGASGIRIEGDIIRKQEVSIQLSA